jgi:Tfp pilus assembly protein PilF
MRATVFLLIFSVTVSFASAQQIEADDAGSPQLQAILNAGIKSFRAADYDDAVANFRHAIQIEPANDKAHLYLGTAYAAQVVPNLKSPENLKTASLALAEFDIVS